LVSAVERQAMNVEADLQNALAKITQTRATLDEQRAEMARCKAEGDALNSQNRELEDIATADCPVCEQPLSNDHRSQLLARNQSQLQELRGRYGATQRQIKTDEEVLQQSESEQQRLEQALRHLPRQDEVMALATEIEAAQQTLNHAQQQVGQLKSAPERVTALEQELNTLGNPRQQSAIAQEQASRQQTLEQQLHTIGAQCQSTEGELAALTQHFATFAKLDEALNKVTTDLERHAAAYQAVLICSDSEPRTGTAEPTRCVAESYRDVSQVSATGTAGDRCPPISTGGASHSARSGCKIDPAI